MNEDQLKKWMKEHLKISSSLSHDRWDVSLKIIKITVHIVENQSDDTNEQNQIDSTTIYL